MTTVKVGLVGCAAQKLARPAPARNLYTSDLFRKCAAYAEATCDSWYVLSALHGLVDPDEVLEPYNVKLGVNAGPIWTWADRVANQLRERLAWTREAGYNVTLVALCGEQYRTVLYRLREYPAEVPMKGLGIGQQKAWLKGQLHALEYDEFEAREAQAAYDDLWVR